MEQPVLLHLLDESSSFNPQQGGRNGPASPGSPKGCFDVSGLNPDNNLCEVYS